MPNPTFETVSEQQITPEQASRVVAMIVELVKDTCHDRQVGTYEIDVDRGSIEEFPGAGGVSLVRFSFSLNQSLDGGVDPVFPFTAYGRNVLQSIKRAGFCIEASPNNNMFQLSIPGDSFDRMSGPDIETSADQVLKYLIEQADLSPEQAQLQEILDALPDREGKLVLEVGKRVSKVGRFREIRSAVEKFLDEEL